VHGCASASGFVRSSAWWIDWCVLPNLLVRAEKGPHQPGINVIAGSSGCLVRVRTDSSSSGETACSRRGCLLDDESRTPRQLDSQVTDDAHNRAAFLRLVACQVGRLLNVLCLPE